MKTRTLQVTLRSWARAKRMFGGHFLPLTPLTHAQTHDQHIAVCATQTQEAGEIKRILDRWRASLPEG